MPHRPFPVVVHAPYIVSEDLDLRRHPRSCCPMHYRDICVCSAMPAHLVNLHSLHGGLHVVTEEFDALHVIQDAWQGSVSLARQAHPVLGDDDVGMIIPAAGVPHHNHDLCVLLGPAQVALPTGISWDILVGAVLRHVVKAAQGVSAQHRLCRAASKVQQRLALTAESLASKASRTHRLSTQLSIFLKAQGVW